VILCLSRPLLSLLTPAVSTAHSILIPVTVVLAALCSRESCIGYRVQSNPLTLILAMLIIGFISFIERVLLACIQYRQGPSSSLLHGVAHIILDGIKLYSKASLDVLVVASGIIFVGSVLALCCSLNLLILGNNLVNASRYSDLIVLLFSLGIMIQLGMAMAISNVSRYIHIGMARAIKASILSDILLLGCCIALCLLFRSSSLYSSYLCSLLLLVILICILISAMVCTGRAPFDLSEAESELVAGNMLELGGVTFSFLLLAEYYESFMLIGLACMLIAIGASFVLMLALCIVVIYVGRMIVLRFTVPDTARLCLAHML